MADLTAYVIVVAILIGLFAGMRPGSITNGFTEGAKSLLYPALLVGFAGESRWSHLTASSWTL